MNKENEITIAQDNALTNSRQNFTVIEKRCLYQVIYEVRKRYVDSGNSKYEDMRLYLSPESLLPLADRPREAYSALRKLREREIEIENDEMWLSTSWILQAKHDKKNNIYEVLVSKDIMPYLVRLASKFTVYSLTVAIALKSSYSQRMYELCSQYRNRPNKTFFLTVEEIREKFGIGEKYRNGAMFKRRILDVAQTEIKDLFDKGQCDLWFDYKPKDKEGKKVISYFFHLHRREDNPAAVDFKSVTKSLQRIMDILKPFFPNDKKYIERVFKEVQARPEIADDLQYKLEQKILDYETPSIPPIIRYVLSNDYGIK